MANTKGSMKAHCGKCNAEATVDTFAIGKKHKNCSGREKINGTLGIKGYSRDSRKHSGTWQPGPAPKRFVTPGDSAKGEGEGANS